MDPITYLTEGCANASRHPVPPGYRRLKDGEQYQPGDFYNSLYNTESPTVVMDNLENFIDGGFILNTDDTGIVSVVPLVAYYRKVS